MTTSRHAIRLAFVLFSICALALKVGRLGVLQAHLSVGTFVLFVYSDVLAYVALYLITVACCLRSRHALRACQLILAVWLVILFVVAGYVALIRVPFEYPVFAVALSGPKARMGVAVEAVPPVFGLAMILALFVLLWMPSRRLPRPGVALSKAGRWTAGSVAAICAVIAFAVPLRGSFESGYVREPVLHLIASGIAFRKEMVPPTSMPARKRGSRVVWSSAPPPDVIVVLLESTGAHATTPYFPHRSTTPFLDLSAHAGLLVERAYAVIPHTSKSVVSILCGVEPQLGVMVFEARTNGLRAQCLAHYLGGRNYATAFFQTATQYFEDAKQLANNAGYAKFVSGDQVPAGKYERTNYFGYEDASLLGPIEQWVRSVPPDQPLHLALLTNGPHHDYGVPSHVRIRPLSLDSEQNRWLNLIAEQDRFLRTLSERIQMLRVGHPTVFVFVGDHGEAFGEHVARVHDDVPWDEGLRVPLVFVGARVPARVVSGAHSQLDIVPTLLDLAGATFDSSAFEGQSLLRPHVHEELFAACLTDYRCLVRIAGSEKYIHNYGVRSDELYELDTDPREKLNRLKANGREVSAIEVGRVLGWSRSLHRSYESAEVAPGSAK